MRAYRVAYDGRPFRGFQRQPDVPTVENALLEGLRALDVLDGPGEGDGAGTVGDTPAGWAAAGRTDSRVSALAQTVAFDAPAWLSPAAFTSELPDGVFAWAAADAPGGFHATHDAVERAYRYHLHAPGVPVSRIRAAFDRLRGRHDFHNLTPAGDGTERRLAGSVRREGAFLAVTVRAGGFPRQFVRRLAGLLDEVARGAPLGRVRTVLGDEPLDGPAGLQPAAPEPLVLTDVTYPDLAFESDPEVADRARAAFRDRYRTTAGAGRAARTVAGGL